MVRLHFLDSRLQSLSEPTWWIFRLWLCYNRDKQASNTRGKLLSEHTDRWCLLTQPTLISSASPAGIDIGEVLRVLRSFYLFIFRVRGTTINSRHRTGGCEKQYNSFSIYMYICISSTGEKIEVHVIFSLSLSFFLSLSCTIPRTLK